MLKHLVFALSLTWNLFAIAAIKLNGAGATFPYPIYSKWISEYQKDRPNVQVNYQSIGSGGGIRQVIKGTVDFGASDVPMREREKAKSTHQILHVPTVIGAVVVAYNLPSLKKPLRLDGETIAALFSGKIVKWDDKRIADLNPGVALPALDILSVHRADRSGTTGIFTDYLSNVSSAWKKDIGNGKAVKWPGGIGGKGNEGVTGIVKQTKGSVGYVELAYAIQNKLAYVVIKNASGKFVHASLDSIASAASNLKDKEVSSLAMSIVNSKNPQAYPISAMTYILLPLTGEKTPKYSEVIRFLIWAQTKGQKFASKLHYAPLPKVVGKKIVRHMEKLIAKKK